MDTQLNPHSFAPQPAAASESPITPIDTPDLSSEPKRLASPPAKPIPVVRVLSPMGVEYVFLTITLFGGAIALAAALISLVNGKTDFQVLSFPAAVLLVTVPVFTLLFLRLKKLEVARPELRLDASKRRSTQFTQIVTFAACLFALIGFVFDIFAKIGGQSGPTIVKAGLDALCILAVAGGILFYYWRDEHKT